MDITALLDDPAPAARPTRGTPEATDLDIRSVDDFESALRELTGLAHRLSPEIWRAVDELFLVIGTPRIQARAVHANFYGRMNQKLMANRNVLREIYAYAASLGITFNYPTKREIAWAVDSGDDALFCGVIQREAPDRDFMSGMLDRFEPVTREATRALIVAETVKPTKLRKAADREVVQDVFDAAAGPLVWSLWAPEPLHRHFQPTAHGLTYLGDYLSDLRSVQPRLFDRDRALVVTALDARINESYEILRSRACRWLRTEYGALNNYGYLGILLESEADP